MFYILQWSYEPNTASENRMQAYLKAMDELGFEATVVYLYIFGNITITHYLCTRQSET